MTCQKNAKLAPLETPSLSSLEIKWTGTLSLAAVECEECIGMESDAAFFSTRFSLLAGREFLTCFNYLCACSRVYPKNYGAEMTGLELVTVFWHPVASSVAATCYVI